MPQKHRPVKFCCQCGYAAHYKCAGCSYGSRARYCCRVCQKVDWGRHQETCPRDDTTVACKIYEEDITVAELATMTRLVASTVCHRSSGPCVQQEVVFRRQIDTLWTEIKNRVPAGYRGLQPIAEWDVMNFNKNKKWADDHVNQRKANANGGTPRQMGARVYGCMDGPAIHVYPHPRTLPCSWPHSPSEIRASCSEEDAAFRRILHRPRFAPTCTEEVISWSTTGEFLERYQDRDLCKVVVPGARTFVTAAGARWVGDGFKLGGITDIVDDEFTLDAHSVANIVGNLTVVFRRQISFFRAVSPCASFSCCNARGR